jgi:hypothetical protein
VREGAVGFYEVVVRIAKLALLVWGVPVIAVGWRARDLFEAPEGARSRVRDMALVAQADGFAIVGIGEPESTDSTLPPVLEHLDSSWRDAAIKFAGRSPRHALTLARTLEKMFDGSWEDDLRADAASLVVWLRCSAEPQGRLSPGDRAGTRDPSCGARTPDAAATSST